MFSGDNCIFNGFVCEDARGAPLEGVVLPHIASSVTIQTACGIRRGKEVIACLAFAWAVTQKTLKYHLF